MKSHYTEYKPCLYTSQDMGRVVCVGDEQMPAPFIFLASWEAEFLRSPSQCGGQLVGYPAHTPVRSPTEQGCRGPPTGPGCRAFAPGPCCRLHQEEAGSPKDSGQQMAGHPLSGPLAWRGQGVRALPSQTGFCLTRSGMFPSGAQCYRVDTAPAAHGAASQDHSVRLIHFVLLKAKPRSGEGGNVNPFIV